jgi:hypothetical protein
MSKRKWDRTDDLMEVVAVLSITLSKAVALCRDMREIDLGLAIMRYKQELEEKKRMQEDYGNEYRDSSTPNSGSYWRKAMFGA